MKLTIEQLLPNLTKNILPVYLVSGDEFLLVEEACATIRKYLKEREYNARETFYVETGCDWGVFLNSINNLSLFAEKTLIELHLKDKLTEAGSKIVQNYLKNPACDKILLIKANRLDAVQQATAWFKAVDTYGAILQIWPIELAQLPTWLAKRLRVAGFNVTLQATQVLADKVSGNLFAAVQEINKLSLLYGNGYLTTEQVIAATSDNSHFTIYNLLDAAISKNKALVIRILDRLKAEAVEPTLILWAITNELRTLISVSFAIKNGVGVEQAMTKYKVWYGRKSLIKKMLQRYNMAELQEFLKQVIYIDFTIKGADTIHLMWHELGKFYLSFCKI